MVQSDSRMKKNAYDTGLWILNVGIQLYEKYEKLRYFTSSCANFCAFSQYLKMKTCRKIFFYLDNIGS